MNRGINIAQEYYLPETMALGVGEEIEIYIGTMQDTPSGVEYTAYLTQLGLNTDDWDFSDFELNVLQGSLVELDGPDAFHGRMIRISEQNGLYEVHVKMVPMKAGQYGIRVELSAELVGTLYHGGYIKDLYFTVTE
jgi:hypothetical protein